MQRDQLIDRLRRLRPELADRGVTHLALFGSRARGDHRPDSDVDLFLDVERGRKFSLLDLIGIEHQLTDSIGLAANITMRRSLSPEFREKTTPDVVEIF